MWPRYAAHVPLKWHISFCNLNLKCPSAVPVIHLSCKLSIVIGDGAIVAIVIGAAPAAVVVVAASVVVAALAEHV